MAIISVSILPMEILRLKEVTLRLEGAQQGFEHKPRLQILRERFPNRQERMASSGLGHPRPHGAVMVSSWQRLNTQQGRGGQGAHWGPLGATGTFQAGDGVFHHVIASCSGSPLGAETRDLPCLGSLPQPCAPVLARVGSVRDGTLHLHF